MRRKYELTAIQMRCAEILATNDIEQKTMAQIAEELGISERVIYNWKRDEDFIAYKNDIAERIMDEFIDDAYKELRRIGTKGKQEGTRVKALEVVLKTRGKLTDVHKVEQTIKDERTNESIEAEIERLNKQLEGILVEEQGADS